MITDFIKIGKDKGDCTVFAKRNYGHNGITPEHSAFTGPDQIDIINMYMIYMVQLLSSTGKSLTKRVDVAE